ncbi:MAG: membrane protein insertion efficiency factor YidD [Lentisphaeria bacterium]
MLSGIGGKAAAYCVRFYQLFISCFKPACCRFYPTCSEYSRQAFLQHGLFFGLILSCWRILRCQPFYRGPFYDPVPDKIHFFKRKK